MKCVRCHVDTKYKDRSSGRCSGCNRPFAFEPRNGDPLTDTLFDAAIDAVSARDSLFFNASHLYYEVCRRIARRNELGKNLLQVGTIALFGTAFASFVTGMHLWVVGVPIFGLGAYLKQKPLRFKTVRLSREKFDTL